MKRNLSQIIISGIVSLCICCSCEKWRTDIPEDTPGDNIPTEDIVNTRFHGKVHIAETGELLTEFLQKRFPNVSNEWNEETQLIILGERTAAVFLENEESFQHIMEYWFRNNALAFINPGSKCLTLWNALRMQDISEAEKHITPELVSSYNDILVKVVRADGNMMTYHKLNKQNRAHIDIENIIKKEGSAGEQKTNTTSEEYEFVPKDFNIGLAAERVSEWMNNYFLNHPGSDIALRSSEEADYEGNMSTHTIYKQITVSHSICYDYYWCRMDEIPKAATTEAIVRINTIAGYNDIINGDVYDITLIQEFDAGKTFLDNYLIHEHLAYNWRYSGGYYYGPTVDLKIHGGSDAVFSFYDNTEIYSPVPVPEDNGYSVTHDPGSTTLGGSISGGGSANSKGITGSLSGTFSFSFILPKTTTTVPKDGMPLTYTTNHRDNICWNFESDFEVHDLHWGKNPDFNEPPYITKSHCITEEKVTFGVSNSKSLGHSPVYIDVATDFKTYHELARATIEDEDIRHKECGDHYKRLTSHNFNTTNYTLPQVYRYFASYTPYCFYTSGVVDGGSGWTQLEATLQGSSSDYKALADGTQVRAVTIEELDKNAERIWRSSIERIASLNNGSSTSDSYIIALSDKDNNHLPVGLYIHNKTWEVVEDIDSLKEKLISEESSK